jgi:hypothetical protein
MHQLVEIIDGRFNLVITDNNTSQVLQRSENDRGDKLHRDQFSRRQGFTENQPEQDE